MYRRLSVVMFPIVTLLLIGASLWGYQENQEKNAILIKAENQYQRAFHDLSFHVNKLHTELGNTLAVNSTSHGFQRKGLVNVWRLTSEAQNEINQLPLTLLPFHKTEEFLSNIANFSYRASIRDLTKQPLSSDEMKTLKTLYDRSKEISQELNDVQTKVLSDNLRWMDVESALANEDQALDNSIIDGFKTVDKKVSDYDEVDWGPSSGILSSKRDYKALAGPDITAEEVKDKAAQFLGMKETSQFKVIENGAGTKYNSYSVTATSNEGEDIQMDYSKKGGKLIWFINSRDVGEQAVSIDDATDKAQRFLNKHGYDHMKAISYDGYTNVASIGFATVQDDVIVYPEKLVVKVALDKGEVTGFQAGDYLFEHKKRDLPAPKLTIEEAKQTLNPQLDVTSDHLALIKNEINQEVLCYQFVGKINGTHYRIYINADTGDEEQIEVIQSNEAAEASKL